MWLPAPYCPSGFRIKRPPSARSGLLIIAVPPSTETEINAPASVSLVPKYKLCVCAELYVQVTLEEFVLLD